MKRIQFLFLIFFFGSSLVFAQETNSDVETGETPKIEEAQPEAYAAPETQQIIPESGAEIDGPMTVEAMNAIVKKLDPNAKFLNTGRAMVMKIADVEITIIVDPRSNRMRAFAPVASLDGIDSQTMYRMLQANFDSALDARYSIAKEFVLSAYIHPFAELKRVQFIEGIGQVVNLVKTFGTAYTSGGMTFGGGDSQKLHRKLIDELIKKGDTI